MSESFSSWLCQILGYGYKEKPTPHSHTEVEVLHKFESLTMITKPPQKGHHMMVVTAVKLSVPSGSLYWSNGLSYWGQRDRVHLNFAVMFLSLPAKF